MYGSRLGAVDNLNITNVSAPSQWPKRTHTRPIYLSTVNISTTVPVILGNISYNINSTNTISHLSNNNLNIDDNITHNNISNMTVISPRDTYSYNSTLKNSIILVKLSNNMSALITPQSVVDNRMLKCPPVPPNLEGPISVNTNPTDINKLTSKLKHLLSPGGCYNPKECVARDKVAIIVPYRDRAEHLSIFLNNLHPFLMKQQIYYQIYIIEQNQGSVFNRAALLNVGYVEALKERHWDCFIFHDIDLLPLDDRNLYNCPDQPRHMSVAVDVFKYKLPYSELFGGVSALTTEQFKIVNGFSNMFWGWGAEDDDMASRIKHHGYHIARYPYDIARYSMLTHVKQKANPKRYDVLNQGKKRYDSEGLNSLQYTRLKLEQRALYTWILVELTPAHVS